MACVLEKGISETRLTLLILSVSKLLPEPKTLLWVQGSVVSCFLVNHY